MFRFFRKSREKTLAENPSDRKGLAKKYRKYTFYVVGEIFIVIIGILLALQVDNWNNQLEDRQEAQVFLIRLKNEFLTNRKQLVQKVTMREKALKSTRELLRFVDGNPEGLRASQIDSLLANALPVYTFDPSLGVLNQLTSTDKLTLIQSEALNDKLSIWDAMIEDFKEDENMYNDYNHNQFRPFLYKNYTARNIINTRIRNRVIEPILLSNPNDVNTEIGFSGQSVNVTALQNSMEFENYLAFCVSWLSLINTQSQGILNYIDSVVEIIDQELEAD
jgi:hypothetical protein